MPPARPRVVDDARSEASFSNSNTRATPLNKNSKPKNGANNALNSAIFASKDAGSAPSAMTSSAVHASTNEPHHEAPHVDWSSLPIQTLHSYRSAYRLQIPSSYTQQHAELLYKSCDLAFRAPSQCLARKKAHDLKVYRKRQLQSNGRVHSNGISKPSKAMRTKEKDGRQKDIDLEGKPVPPVSIEGPPSPTSHPSQADSSNPNTADNGSTSRASPTVDLAHPNIPTTLNQFDPSHTILSSIPSTSLATTIRTHFNAQQVNEAETIARFAYVVRQQGSSNTSRSLPLIQRVSLLPLPLTTAENIANVAETANAALLASSTLLPGSAAAASILGGTGEKDKEKGKSHTGHTSHGLSSARLLSGNHIEVEGSFGDGSGWIMGTTNCGRQVRIADGGTGTFRLRFRP